MLNMACTLFRLTPQEALAGVTLNAAKALGLGSSSGSLEPGKYADMVLWNATDPAELSYRIGSNPCAQVMFRGLVR
jgi:imidazolonepropionase